MSFCAVYTENAIMAHMPNAVRVDLSTDSITVARKKALLHIRKHGGEAIIFRGKTGSYIGVVTYTDWAGACWTNSRSKDFWMNYDGKLAGECDLI